MSQYHPTLSRQLNLCFRVEDLLYMQAGGLGAAFTQFLQQVSQTYSSIDRHYELAQRILAVARKQDDQHKQKEQSLARYQFIVEECSDVLTLCNADHVAVYSSPAVQNLGYECHHFFGGPKFDENIHPDDLLKVEQARKALSGSKEPQTFSYRVKALRDTPATSPTPASLHPHSTTHSSSQQQQQQSSSSGAHHNAPPSHSGNVAALLGRPESPTSASSVSSSVSSTSAASAALSSSSASVAALSNPNLSSSGGGPAPPGPSPASAAASASSSSASASLVTTDSNTKKDKPLPHTTHNLAHTQIHHNSSNNPPPQPSSQLHSTITNNKQQQQQQQQQQPPQLHHHPHGHGHGHSHQEERWMWTWLETSSRLVQGTTGHPDFIVMVSRVIPVNTFMGKLRTDDERLRMAERALSQIQQTNKQLVL